MGTIKVFEGISFSVDYGDRLAIVGRNGTGKSTLLKIIANELTPDSGEIIVKSDVSVIYLAQNVSNYLAPNLTVFEHILLGKIDKTPSPIKKVETISNKKEIKNLFELYDIPLINRLDNFVGNLSGGEQQLVAISTLLYTKPNLLLFDEFNSSLDPKSSDKVIEVLLNYLNKNKAAILFVTHDEKIRNHFSTNEINLGR